MIETVFRSEDLPPQDRFDGWRECQRQTHAPLDATSRYAPDYRAHQRNLRLGAVTVWPATFQPVVLRRTPKLIRQSDPESCHVSLIVRGTGGAAWHDRSLTYRRYDFATQSSSLPCTMWADEGQDALTMIGVEVPMARLPLRQDDIHRVIGRPMSGRNGAGALLAGFLTRLTRTAASHRDTDGPRLGTVVADLVAALFANTLEDDRSLPLESHRRILMLRIQAFINQHLSDADLSPAAIAAAHHISLSYLHRLFHIDGTSVMTWIRRQRLERARHDLTNGTTPVHQIAARWGFPRHSVFTRAFRAEYHISPSGYREEMLIEPVARGRPS